LLHLILEFLAFDTLTQLGGIIILIDAKEAKVKQFKRWEGEKVQLVAKLNDFVPLRIEEIHIVNNKVAVDSAWHHLKHSLSQDVKEKVRIHKKMKDLDVSKDILPHEFGQKQAN